MTLHHSLISTALLALQQSGEFKYQSKCGTVIPSGFYKYVEYLGTDKLSKFQVTVYMTSKSPTGYALRVEAIALMPQIVLEDRNIETFEDFEDAIEADYSNAAYKAMRRRQLGK